MNVQILVEQRNRIRQDEEFWFAQHRDAQTKEELNDYGCLWAQTKELRQRLDSIIAALAARKAEKE